MNHVLVFLDVRVRIIDVEVQAAVVQQDNYERVQLAYWMIWLLFLDVSLVSIDQEKALTKLDVMHVAHKSVLAVSDSTSEIGDTEASVNKLGKHDEYSNFEEQSASVQVVGLNGFQVLDELSLFLHEASFLFAAMLLQVITYFFQMSVAKDVVLGEQVLHFVCSFFVSFLIFDGFLLGVSFWLLLLVSLLGSGATTFELEVIIIILEYFLWWLLLASLLKRAQTEINLVRVELILINIGQSVHK